MTDYKLSSSTLKWIREGRGAGNGKDYHPWLTVRDLSSQGRSHRVWGHLTQRTYHLLSDMELATFLLLEWNPFVTDIREQFPLRVEDTLALAEESNIRHPSIGGHTQIMSTNFIVDLSASSEPQRVAVQVKSSSDLKDPRTVEKMEIERRYWRKMNVQWFLLTEKQIPKVVVKNLELLYSARAQTESISLLFDSLPVYMELLSHHPNTKIPDISMIIDQSYSLEAGTSLSRFRSLMAIRALVFDITIPWSNLKGGNIQFADDIALLRASHAANQ